MSILLLYIFFFKPFKKSFPIIISIIFAMNRLFYTSSILSIGKFSYILTFLFLLKSILQIKKIKTDNIVRISWVLLVIYSISILLFVINNHITDYKVFFRKAGPLILQFYIFIGLIYFNLYGSKLFFSYVYKGMIFYLILSSLYISVIPYDADTGVLGLGVYHHATVGLSAAYIIGYNLLLKKQKFRIIILITVSLLPFLGMGRGGIISVFISYLIYFLYQKKLSSAFFLLVSLFLIIYFSNDLITKILPQSIIYRHLGANNIGELLKTSEDVYSTILPRVFRWTFLIDNFLNNVFFGSGLMLSTVGSGLSESQFVDVWQGHNFFLSMLAVGGLVLSLPILLLTIISIIKSIFVIAGNNKYAFWGMLLIFNIININFTNTYFTSFWAGPLIWSLFAAGLYELRNYGIESMISDNVPKQDTNVLIQKTL